MNAVNARALVVEDDRSWQQILSEILTDAGLTVDVADSAEAAVARLRKISHRVAVVDLALGDGGYDNLDGLRVLDAIRRQDPGCVAIMLTGFATVELAVSVLTEHGAFTCLRKESFSRVEFRDLISQALASAPRLASNGPDSAGGPAIREMVDTARKDLDEMFGSGSALVVEDDAGWRGILSELLTDAGYQVRACSSYGEALGCLRRERYAFAVVDLSLSNTPGYGDTWEPGLADQDMEGYRLLASTSEASIPTIIVSGVATPDEIERAYAERGVFACLSKQTFDRRAFLRVIEEAQTANSLGDKLDGLTRREREVLGLLAEGRTNREIAERLVITINTVKRHLKAIFEKLDVHTRSAAAAKAISAGMPAARPEPEAE